MSDQVRMTSRTVFANERITVFPNGGPEEGVKGGTVAVGQPFTTDRLHARELDALGFAEPDDRADLDGEARLEAGHQVSVSQMRAQDPSWSATVAPGAIAGQTAPVAAPTASAASTTASTAPGDDLVEKTLDELHAIGKAEEIDLGEAKKKGDIIVAIRVARAAKA